MRSKVTCLRPLADKLTGRAWFLTLSSDGIVVVVHHLQYSIFVLK
jgi:hypothetical protein